MIDFKCCIDRCTEKRLSEDHFFCFNHRLEWQIYVIKCNIDKPISDAPSPGYVEQRKVIEHLNHFYKHCYVKSPQNI